MSVLRTERPITPDEKRTLLANGERLESDGRDGTVEVLTVGAKRYAVGEEYNDEGPIFFFELGQNELLVLWGQWLYDSHVVTTELLDMDEIWERNAWFKHFELVRLPSSGLVLSLKSIGHETLNRMETIGVGYRLAARPSELFQESFDALLS